MVQAKASTMRFVKKAIKVTCTYARAKPYFNIANSHISIGDRDLPDHIGQKHTHSRVSQLTHRKAQIWLMEKSVSEHC